MNLFTSRPSRRAVRFATTTGLAAITSMVGCEGLLDVPNPNQLLQEDLTSPAAAAALANGAVATVTSAYGDMVLAHDAASDELQFVGSRTGWLELSSGDLRNPNNEFHEANWPSITRGRWMADEAVELLSGFQADGVLEDPDLLATAQLYSAVLYTLIADHFEDFVVRSDRMENAPPVGSENMSEMYTTAIDNLDSAIAIARSTGNRELETRALAQRARTKHALAIWEMLNPPGTTPASPLVNDPDATADAEAALALMSGADWRFLLRYSTGTVSNSWGSWVNERLDLRVSDAYVQPTPDDKRVEAVTMLDPIDGIPDPALTARINEITQARQFGPVTVTSAREMHLIIAEAALAAGNEERFATHLNAIRNFDGLTPWEGQIGALEMLKHARRVNLFNQGRRLLDHYRFDEPSFLWDPSEEAATRPGTKFPIAAVELRTNCHLLGTC